MGGFRYWLLVLERRVDETADDAGCLGCELVEGQPVVTIEGRVLCATCPDLTKGSADVSTKADGG